MIPLNFVIFFKGGFLHMSSRFEVIFAFDSNDLGDLSREEAQIQRI